MSGYGGRPPGWEDPYGQYGPPGGYGPYGQPGGSGYEQYDYRYGYGPPGVPNTPIDNSSAIVALICNIVATVMCCNVFCIGGIVTAAIAMGKTRTEPHSARKLVMWSWVILGIAVVLEIALIVILMFTADGESNSPYGSGSGI